MLSSQKLIENEINVLVLKKSQKIKVWVNSNLVSKIKTNDELEKFSKEICGNDQIEKGDNANSCRISSPDGESFHKITVVNYKKQKYLLHNELHTKGPQNELRPYRKQLDKLYEGL
ncbi:MAG: hypothetical protein Fur0010_20140 [Bdellovibrio sp.]